jgi:hypothetical protein
MSYLLVGLLALILLGWVGRPGRILKHAQWRIASGATAVGVFAAAAFVGLRGGWGKAILLAVIALGLAMSARWPRTAKISPRPAESMSETQARSLLGVASDATPEAVKAAHARLIRFAHPDRGGTDGLASQLNQARDRLLKP